MYGPVEQVSVPGERGDAVALLVEIREAMRKANATYDLSLTAFLSESWYNRFNTLLRSEGF